jgi:hypothetical protein
MPSTYRVEVHVEGQLKPTIVDATPRDQDGGNKIGRPVLLFEDIRKNTTYGKNLELIKWKVRRGSEKWKGKSSDAGPLLRHGDLIVFNARMRTS